MPTIPPSTDPSEARLSKSSSTDSLISLFSELETTPAVQPFRFFDLPSELRSKIYSIVLKTKEDTIDLHPENYSPGRQRLSIFLVSHRFHTEASQTFYSTHPFRIFPTNGRFMGNRTKPLLTRLPQHYRTSLVALELRLGPGWGRPPKSWRVDERLGLEEMVNVRILKVYVQIDPSQDTYRGFRVSRDFYTLFCEGLLGEIVGRLPQLERVEFDGFPSVMRDSCLMDTLFGVAKWRGKAIVLAPGMKLFQKRAKMPVPSPLCIKAEALLLT